MAGRRKTRAADRAIAAERSRVDSHRASVEKAARAARADGYFNPLSAIGTSADPAFWTMFCPDPVTDLEARELWEGNDLAAKIIELPPNDAFRKAFEIDTGDKVQGEKIMGALEDLNVCEQFKIAAQYERAYGGAALYPVINDGQDFSQPLRENGRIPSITDLIVLEPRELMPVSWYRDLQNSPRGRFRKPMRYRLNPIVPGGAINVGQLIHESRLITFPGIVTSQDRARGARSGWGSSVLTRTKKALAGFGISWAGIETLMHRIEQGVYKLKGFSEMIAQDDGTAEHALGRIDRLRSLVNMLVIDGDDDYQRLGVPLAGVAAILDNLMIRVSASADFPVTRMFGRSPAGQNATGESDSQNWDDVIQALQAHHYGPRVERLVRLYMLSNDSVTGGKEPAMWSVKWLPLRQLTEVEQATRNKLQAEADDIQIQNTVLSAAIVRVKRYGGDTYSMNTQLSPKELNEMTVAEEAAHEAEIAAAEQAAKAAASAPDPNAPAPDPNAPPEPAE